MAEIRAFKGVRYNLDRVGDGGSVVAPPYDVIDARLQQTLYDRHENNIVRIIQGKTGEETAHDNVYTRAQASYNGWLDEGVLSADDNPCLYVYTQTFDIHTPEGTKRKSRQGLVGLVEIQRLGEGGVYPHEHTMPGPKKDRLELMRHTEAAFGQIFSLYSDPDFHVRSLLEPHVQSDPLFQFDDDDGVNHAFWRVGDAKTVERVCEFLATRELFIADGHHRYETAVNHRDERLEGGGEDGAGYCYRMQALVNMDDSEGMAIYPIHRVVTDVAAEDLEALRSRLSDYFEVKEAAFTDVDALAREIGSRAEANRPCFGALLGSPDTVTYLKLRSDVNVVDLDREGHSDAWRRLDSGLLQMVLGEILELDTETLIKGEKVRFIKVEAEVRQAVVESPTNVGFYLNPVGMQQLRDVVLAGERMPPKSTFFYPKVFTGLVIQDFNRS
tara:strand:+ start:673 stop:1998 length:1326 start_codon:yes stop_codon:yes gene_type:complete